MLLYPLLPAVYRSGMFLLMAASRISTLVLDGEVREYAYLPFVHVVPGIEQEMIYPIKIGLSP